MPYPDGRRDYRPGEGPAAGCLIALVITAAVAAILVATVLWVLG